MFLIFKGEVLIMIHKKSMKRIGTAAVSVLSAGLMGLNVFAAGTNNVAGTISSDKASYKAGEVANITVNIENNTVKAAKHLRLTAKLPQGLKAVDQAELSQSADQLAAGASKQFVVKVTKDAKSSDLKKSNADSSNPKTGAGGYAAMSAAGILGAAIILCVRKKDKKASRSLALILSTGIGLASFANLIEANADSNTDFSNQNSLVSFSDSKDYSVAFDSVSYKVNFTFAYETDADTVTTTQSSVTTAQTTTASSETSTSASGTSATSVSAVETTTTNESMVLPTEPVKTTTETEKPVETTSRRRMPARVTTSTTEAAETTTTTVTTTKATTTAKPESVTAKITTSKPESTTTKTTTSKPETTTSIKTTSATTTAKPKTTTTTASSKPVITTTTVKPVKPVDNGNTPEERLNNAKLDTSDSKKSKLKKSIGESEYKIVENYVKSIVKKNNTQAENVAAVYDDIIAITNYETVHNYESHHLNPCKAIFKDHTGQCCEYAAALSAAMNYMGYDAKVAGGFVKFANGNYGQHFWTEVTINGQVYVMDANVDDDITNWNRNNGYSNAGTSHQKFVKTYSELKNEYKDPMGNFLK